MIEATNSEQLLLVMLGIYLAIIIYCLYKKIEIEDNHASLLDLTSENNKQLTQLRNSLDITRGISERTYIRKKNL